MEYSPPDRKRADFGLALRLRQKSTAESTLPEPTWEENMASRYKQDASTRKNNSMNTLPSKAVPKAGLEGLPSAQHPVLEADNGRWLGSPPRTQGYQISQRRSVPVSAVDRDLDEENAVESYLEHEGSKMTKEASQEHKSVASLIQELDVVNTLYTALKADQGQLLTLAIGLQQLFDAKVAHDAAQQPGPIQAKLDDLQSLVFRTRDLVANALEELEAELKADASTLKHEFEQKLQSSKNQAPKADQKTITGLVARLDALERDNERLRETSALQVHRVDALQNKVFELEGTITRKVQKGTINPQGSED
ncbi:unnamed protein product [Zymoseptoria tritici ST99CH_1A5]|uniref:Uncharacterized protein n=1 Tax=Zymoseptoria tritici ST99CH_1A5 TaxID=1276529 RepID=A0A1Y6LZ35_ZYMTR|nr:unnamed protein product [Zymoseptoria tritici ST99CH_1A5]